MPWSWPSPRCPAVAAASVLRVATLHSCVAVAVNRTSYAHKYNVRDLSICSRKGGETCLRAAEMAGAREALTRFSFSPLSSFGEDRTPATSNFTYGEPARARGLRRRRTGEAATFPGEAGSSGIVSSRFVCRGRRAFGSGEGATEAVAEAKSRSSSSGVFRNMNRKRSSLSSEICARSTTPAARSTRQTKTQKQLHQMPCAQAHLILPGNDDAIGVSTARVVGAVHGELVERVDGDLLLGAGLRERDTVLQLCSQKVF